MINRKFVTPQSASDEDDLASLLASFGLSDPTPPAPTDPPTPTEPTPPEPTPADPNAPPVPNPDPTPAPTPAPVEPPANAAFAQMRVQNATYEKTLSNLAKALGIKENDPNKLTNLLDGKVREIIAKQSGTPVEVLTKLDTLEKQNIELTALQLKNNAFAGFEMVKQQFGLDDVGMKEYADQLVKAGMNPFTQNVDLVTMYKMLNFDKIVATAEERGKAAEAERLKNLAAHGTAPIPQVGGAGTGTEEIGAVKTAADFEKLLNTLK